MSGSTPVIKKMLSFSEAMAQIVSGKKVTKLEWANKQTYGFLSNGILMIRLEGKDHNWILKDGDIEGKDYIVV